MHLVQTRIELFKRLSERAVQGIHGTVAVGGGVQYLARHLHLDRGFGEEFGAAALFDKMNPPQQVATPSGYGTWDFFDAPAGDNGDFIKKLIDSRGEDDRLVLAEAGKVMQEIRGTSSGARR